VLADQLAGFQFDDGIEKNTLQTPLLFQVFVGVGGVEMGKGE